MDAARKVGMIGLGLLGSALDARLLAADWQVVGFDLDAERRAQHALRGGSSADGADDVFRACDVVVLSLPDSDVVSELLGDVEAELRSDTIVVDTTTGDPAQAVANGQLVAARGAGYVEATIAGSSALAREGKAAVFVGGADSHVASAEPALKTVSSKRFHLGEVGTASRFKLVHNMLLGLQRAVLAETLAFAESMGFDAAEAVDILLQTPAASAAMEAKGYKMAARDYSAQARLSQHVKDVRLIRAAAEASGAPTPLTQAHERLLAEAESRGYGEKDNSAVIEALREQGETG